jgi:Polyketide cyclase / dehydrase and lipid transport
MREYEQAQTIGASADEAFAWLSDVSNLPKYLPPVVGASVEGPSAEGVPGQRVRATLEYPGEGRGTFDAEGYLAVDKNRRRMEWGAEVERDYSGWLEVAKGADGESQVTVHLNFGKRSIEPEMRERTPDGRDPLAEGISATLESIRRQIEEGSGKVEPPLPPPGVELPTGENPAVVDVDAPDAPQR